MTKFIELFPPRSSYGRGAGYEFEPDTKLLTVTTNRKDRRYVLTAIYGGWTVRKLDISTDPTETHYSVSESFKCDCKGFVRFRYCCHSDAVKDLVGAGLLEVKRMPTATPKQMKTWEADF